MSPQPESLPPSGLILPLDVTADTGSAISVSHGGAASSITAASYSPEKQRDLVRLLVASGLLLILGYLVVFATVEASSYPAHWAQTKEMLQIILPAVTGILGTVIGFYFGTTAVNQAKANSGAD